MFLKAFLAICVKAQDVANFGPTLGAMQKAQQSNKLNDVEKAADSAIDAPTHLAAFLNNFLISLSVA